MGLHDLLRTFDDEKTIEAEGNTYVEKSSEGVSLKGVLQRGRLKLIKERVMYPAGKTFRPSGFSYPYCRRLKVAQLAELVDIYDSKPAPKLQTVFDMGHAIHDIFQGYFWEMGILRGDYECLKCDKTYEDLLSPTVCPSGIASHKRKHLRYREIQLRNDEYRIKGRCDGILDIDGVHHIMDIKSIANRGPNSGPFQITFEDLAETGPKSDHVVQLQLYMWMSGVHNGHLLYVSKNTHQIKSFAVAYDFNLLEPYLQEIAELIEMSEKIKKKLPVVLPSACGNENCFCHQAFLKKRD